MRNNNPIFLGESQTMSTIQYVSRVLTLLVISTATFFPSAPVVASFYGHGYVSQSPSSSSGLRVGFYHSTCPSAETVISQVVDEAVSRNPNMGASLIRMLFHDCFVRGCDASVLIKTPGNDAERDHPANNPSLKGFDVIDKAKSRLEAVCPGTVSCADIIAYAARDSANKAGNIYYHVPAGRRDGRVSIASEVPDNLPPPNLDADQLIANFAKKGLTADEMVTLSGAHSIGVSHCTSFMPRLNSFNSTHTQDPTLDSKHAKFLRNKCPARTDAVNGEDPIVPLETITPHRLDNKYYKELIRSRGLLVSDQALYASSRTAGMVWNNAKHNSLWARKFARAMIRMGSIEVLTGGNGEIRRKCSAVN